MFLLRTALQLPLAKLPIRMPWEPEELPGPVTSTDVRYFEWIERHSQLLYPVLALGAILLIAFGVLQAWRSQGMSTELKTELKREIILQLRVHMGGASVEILSRAIGLEPFKLARLLDEMQRDGMVTSHTNTERLTVYQLKGVGSARY